MKRLATRLLACLMFTTAFILPTFAQGLYWESTSVISAMGGKERHSKTYYMPKMYKETSDFGNEVSIIRLDKSLFITVNTKDKTYSEMTFDEMEGMMKQAGGAMNEKLVAMQEQMKSLPEEQRKMVEKMMGGAMPTTSTTTAVTVKKGIEKKTISGFTCTEHVVKKGDDSLVTIWATKDIPGIGAMTNELKDFMSRIAATIPMNGKSLAEGYKNIEGFPIKTEMSVMTRTVNKVERRSTPASEFEVPEGYKKVKSKLMEMQEKMKDGE